MKKFWNLFEGSKPGLLGLTERQFFQAFYFFLLLLLATVCALPAIINIG